MKKKSLSAKKIIHKKLLNYLKNPKINKTYKRFRKSLILEDGTKVFSIALSGGPDSLALAYLAKCYSIINNIRVTFYHVNHKLRKESTNEAIKIKSTLKNFDIDCKILVWKGSKPKSNMQSLARKKRYSLIINQSKKDKSNIVLIAHHSDDLYENFLIRLVRGSGLKGLASFNKVKNKDDESFNILRPLINLKKIDLIYISEKVFNFYIQDTSNYDTYFKRIRIRNLISNLKNEGLDENKLRLTINNLRDSNETINYYVENNIKVNSFFSKKKSVYILNKEFFNQPHEVVFRSLSNVLKKIGNKYYSSRGKSLNRVLYRIKTKNFYKVTLSGCIIEKINKSVIIYKEIIKNG